jgi:diguanylate cyclase (GGDEF)-like protein
VAVAHHAHVLIDGGSEGPPSAHSQTVQLRAVEAAPEPAKTGMSLKAKTYFGVVATAAAVASALSIAQLRLGTHGWLAFAILTVVAAVAQLFIVEKGGNQTYRTAIAFILGAAILLHPGFVVLLAALHYVPAWLKFRKRWLVQSFNICNTTLAALAAWAAFHSLSATNVLEVGNARFALAGLAACMALVAVNHVLLAGIIHFTTGKSLTETGLLSFEWNSTDLGLAALGVGVAAFWSVNPWLIVFVAAPLVLIHRAMYVPQLEEKARLDAKTGLLNAREFETSLRTEIERSTRAGTPLSLLMLDLDFLRDINNTHGHLAGDVVIRGIADIFREHLRRYDVASRFGGEEFAILLPETEPAVAALIAERIREAVAERPFQVETSPEPLHATVSTGVAGCPEHATSQRDLIHRADLAVYRAKAGGRNRVAVSRPDDE